MKTFHFDAMTFREKGAREIRNKYLYGGLTLKQNKWQQILPRGEIFYPQLVFNM